MHTIRPMHTDLTTRWEVGYWLPPDAERSTNTWFAVFSSSTARPALECAHYLNGGSRPTAPSFAIE